jgi:hypothetical protein
MAARAAAPAAPSPGGFDDTKAAARRTARRQAQRRKFQRQATGRVSQPKTKNTNATMPSTETQKTKNSSIIFR